MSLNRDHMDYAKHLHLTPTSDHILNKYKVALETVVDTETGATTVRAYMKGPKATPADCTLLQKAMSELFDMSWDRCPL